MEVYHRDITMAWKRRCSAILKGFSSKNIWYMSKYEGESMDQIRPDINASLGIKKYVDEDMCSRCRVKYWRLTFPTIFYI